MCVCVGVCVCVCVCVCVYIAARSQNGVQVHDCVSVSFFATSICPANGLVELGGFCAFYQFLSQYYHKDGKPKIPTCLWPTGDGGNLAPPNIAYIPFIWVAVKKPISSFYRGQLNCYIYPL